MEHNTFIRTYPPLFAALFGYFLAWFLFGVNTFSMGLILLCIGLWLSYITEGKAGMGGFIISLVLVLSFPIFVLSLRLVVQLGNYTSGMGSDGIGITTIYAFGMLLASSFVLFGTYFLAQYKEWPIWFPLTPQFFLLGVMAFAYAPAVPVDCRYAPTNYSTGKEILEEKFPWINAKYTSDLPDNQELLDIQLTPSYGWFTSTNCSRDKMGHPRMLSFRSSKPMLLAYRAAKDQNNGGYAAIFDPKTGKKLSRWHHLSGQNNIYFLIHEYHPYGLMGELSRVFSQMQIYSYNYIPNLPVEFYDDLSKEYQSSIKN